MAATSREESKLFMKFWSTTLPRELMLDWMATGRPRARPARSAARSTLPRAGRNRSRGTLRTA